MLVMQMIWNHLLASNSQGVPDVGEFVGAMEGKYVVGAMDGPDGE